MALPNETKKSFNLYVTYVDSESYFLKISGQTDQQSSLLIETLFEGALQNLENGIGSVPATALREGILCAAKFKDGTYYRARIISLANLANGLVGVHFIDYGNKDIISLSTIRLLDNYDPMFVQLPGQATDYFLTGIMHHKGKWEETLILKLQSFLCYVEYPITIETQTQTLPIISVQFRGTDLSTHLLQNNFGISVPLARQEAMINQLANDNQRAASWQPNFLIEPPPIYSEHVPFLINRNFPANPASAMRLQQNVSILPFNGSVPPPSSAISQRLVVNRTSRNSINLKPPARQPQHANTSSTTTSPPPLVVAANKPTSPKKSSSTYKSRLLEVNSHHKVFVSFAEEGPELFAVQLVTDAKKLQDMMDDINKRPHSSLKEPPMIGTVCLGRMSGDRIICRAIVMNLSGSQCKLFFVDFGDTEMVSYYDIFDIPEEFVKPNVFAMRFCLSGVKKLEKGPYLNETFKQLVNGKVLTLKVVTPEGPPLIQYGELYLDNMNVLDLLLANMKEKLQLKWLDMLPLGSKCSVLVSYVDSCIKFYIQLSDNIDELNAVMKAVRVHCENTSSPGELPIGAACCAKFPDDGNWYRARVRETKGNMLVVAYVDYGNEQEVEVSDLRTITPELIKLPAQAMKCALKGFENKPVETKTSNQLEMLALEKTLMAHIVGVLSSDTMLVSLIDDTVTPPLDIARRMNQLSQPRCVEPKVTTPVRKDAPETFSSPEGSLPDDKKNYRREKSFRDERRPAREPREGNDDFGQRGGSFRSREGKDSFERSAPGRHSDKFGSRPDRGDRRGGAKPRENNTTPQSDAAPAAEEWDEAPSPPSSQQHTSRERPFNRDNNRDNNRDFNRDNKREFNRDNNRDFNRESNRDKHRDFNRDNGRDFNRENNRDSNFSRDNNRDFNRDNNREFNRDRDFSRDNNRDFSRDNNRDFSRDNNRDFNRDRKKPRSDHHPSQKPGWKNRETGGVGKRLRQAAEAASADTDRPNVPKASVQDRLKRDRKENWNQKRDFKDNRSERGERGERAPRSNFTPRERAERDKTHNSGSEKSFHSQDGTGRAPPFKSRGKFTQVQYKELTEPVPLDEPFVEPTVELGAQHEISVTWIISPENFYTQILSLQPKFLEMMHKIPELYKGVKSYTGAVAEGASVLARYPLDGVLYRATVVAVQPFSKFIVRYVDFGNKQLVDAKDIWQLDRELMELPKMAVHCSLLGVKPVDGEWKSKPEIDLCFNAPRYQCIFQDFADNQFRVSLWNNGVSVADTLVEKQLAVMSEQQPSATLKDEAIDLTIIVGQQILCKVTHVESYEKFYVQLDLDKAELVEKAVAAFDVNLLAPLAAESLTEGVHCTVKHEGKVFRAILTDASDTANIKAVLPDYGNTIVTSPENLMILPSELSVYYYQSLECCLNNYTSESKTLMTLEELKSRLTGNKFIVYINEVEGISLVTTLYDVATGHKVAAFEPDEGAYDEVVQLCMRAVFNHNFGMAYISHAESLNEIYMQRAGDTDAVAQLLDKLFAFYEEGTPEALTSFDVDGLCAAKSADGNWYRATIISTTDTEAKVQYPDYGNTETVTKDSLKKLDPQFFEPCAFAVVVGLGLVALQDDAVSKLVEWTEDKAIQVTLTVGSDGWLANLHLDGVDLSMKLVDDKLATPQQESQEEEQKPEAVTEEPISLPAGCMQVYISHIDSPGQFWLQMSDKVNTIDEIQAELQAKVETYPDIESREMGTLCVARYSADDQWYRAEILDADSDITTVRFIDYGNTDVLDNQPGLLKVMPDHLRDSERYAVKASVNAVPTGTGQWSEPASDYFTQLCGDLSVPVDALIVLKDVTTYVDIFVNGQNLTDKLVSEGHATRSEEAECGDLPSCFASHVNSPSEFWIQLEAATSELQAMENAMVDAENFPELVDKEEGVICAAKYPEDGAWYRAQVIVDGSEGTEVLFMDYGNASIATELRSLPDELKVKPALSRKCALQKPRDVKSWSRKSEVKFSELAAEGATIFNVQFIASGDISIVELYQEGKSVTEELVVLCEEQPTSERPTPVGQEYVGCSGKVAHFNSLEDFYVHLDESITDLEKITNKLVNGFEFEPVPELKVGSVCAALWSDDELWYRAKIQEFTDDGYLVLFVDHGNEAICEPSHIKHLPEDLAAIEPLAKCCRLAGFNENEDLKKKLASYLASEECGTFQIEFLDSSKVPALVRLLLDGEDICKSTLIPEIIDTVTTDMFKEDIEQIEVVEEMDIVKESIKEVETERASEIANADLDPKADNNETEANKETDIAISITNEVDTCKETELIEVERKETAVQEVLDSILENAVTTKSDPNNEINKEHKVPDEEISQSKSANDFDLSEALNTSLPELDDSIDSSNTVIENTSFERKDQDLLNTDECSKQNFSTSTLEDENKHSDEVAVETNSSPERDISKESISIDTGYISGSNIDTSLTVETESTEKTIDKGISPEELGQVAEKEIVTVGSSDKVIDVNKT